MRLFDHTRQELKRMVRKKGQVGGAAMPPPTLAFWNTNPYSLGPTQLHPSRWVRRGRACSVFPLCGHPRGAAFSEFPRSMTTDSTTRLGLNSASFSSKALQPDNLFPTPMLSSTHRWSGIFLWSCFEHFCLHPSPIRLLGFTHHDASPERIPQGYTDGHVDVHVDQHEAAQGNVE